MVVTKELQSWISKGKKLGFSEKELRSRLKKEGYSTDDIAEVFGTSPSFKNAIKKAFRIIAFDQDTIKQVSQDPKATKQGVLILLTTAIIFGFIGAAVFAWLLTFLTVLLSGLLLSPGSNSGDLTSILPFSWLAAPFVFFPIMIILLVLVGFVMNLLLVLIKTGILHLSARLFGGQASFEELFRPFAFLFVIQWVLIPASLIPFFSIVVGFASFFYLIAINVVIIKTVHGFSTGRAIAAFLVPTGIVLLILSSIAYWLMVSILVMSGPTYYSTTADWESSQSFRAPSMPRVGSESMTVTECTQKEGMWCYTLTTRDGRGESCGITEQECEEAKVDAVISENARRKNDVRACKEIKNEASRDKCFTDIAMMRRDTSVCDWVSSFGREMCLSAVSQAMQFQ